MFIRVLVSTVSIVALVALNSATASAAQVLIYGPSLDTTGDTDAQSVAMAEGHTVTVFDSVQWAAASAATFGSFDAIVIDDAGCNGDETLLDVAFANDEVWGPEITGNAVLHTFDPGAHASSDPEGVTLVANGINWAASGSDTGFYMTTGCYFESDGAGSFTITGLGTFGFDDQGGDVVVILDGGHPVMAGLTNGGLSNWGASVHAHFTGVPVGFDILAVEEEDATPDAVILAREGLSAESRATFAVDKFFDDGNTSEVEVTLSCNTGLPLEQATTISEGDGVVFVVTEFNEGEMDCAVTETVGVDGYAVEYDNGTVLSDESCVFEAVGFEDANTCVITNTLDTVEVVVTKVWIDENPQFEAQNVAGASWSCSNISDTCDGIGGCNTSGFLNFNGNPDSDSFFVFPDWETGTTCSITEVDLLESGIEVDDSDCQGLLLFPGEGASCTIVNTRLFEGIPTLSQYGLALLALLMLGVGFVAYRRIV